MKNTSIVIITFMLSLIACSEQRKKPAAAASLVKTISTKDTALYFNNGIYYYQNKPFTGIINESYADGHLHHSICLLNGKQEGWQFSYYANGNVMSKRWYHLGEKDSVQLGWYNNGAKQFEYNFSMGKYNGDYKEWYASGQLYKQVFFKDGNDLYGKAWRENGSLFTNYISKDGRRFGLINSKLCYSLKEENSEYAFIKEK